MNFYEKKDYLYGEKKIKEHIKKSKDTFYEKKLTIKLINCRANQTDLINSDVDLTLAD